MQLETNKNKIITKAITGSKILGASIVIQHIITISAQIVLARMLEPSDFGLFAFILMITSFFQVFINLHGDKYLIKEKSPSNEMINNIITIELFIVVFLFVTVYLLCPYFLSLINKSHITIFVQFFCIIFFFTPFSKIKALHERNLSFFKSHFPLIFGNLVGSIIGISLAFYGYGIWSLLWWRVSSLFFETITLWALSSFVFKLTFNKDIAKEVVHFGKPLMLTSLFIFISSYFDYYIVESLTSIEQLGYYSLAFQMSHFLLNIRGAINTLIYPTLSRLKEKEIQNNFFNLVSHITSVIYLIPATIFMIFGEKIIVFIYGIKWLPSVIPFKVFFVIVLIKAIGGISISLFYSSGNTLAHLRLSYFSILTVPFVYFGTLYLGIIGASIGVLLTGLITILFSYEKYTKPLTGHGFYYYMHKPLLITGITIFLFFISNWFNVTFWTNLICCTGVLLLIYKFYKFHVKAVYRAYM